MLSELAYDSKVENNQVHFTYPATQRSEKNLWEDHIPPTENNGIDVDGWHLPGQYEKRVGLCGIWSYMGCLNKSKHPGKCIFLKPFQRSCFRADCEKCCWKWLGRESSKATKRIEKFKKKSKMGVKHLVLSVPKSDYYKEKKVLMKKVRKILNCGKKNFRRKGKVYKYSHNCEKDKNGNTKYCCLESNAGLIIFHPFRINKDSRRWEYQPHFHILGFYPFLKVDLIKKLYSEHGYVIKNLGFRNTTFGTIYYQLSHAGIKKDTHSLVYYGGISYSKLKLENEVRNCPYCQEKLESVDWAYEQGIDSGFPPDPNIMEVWYLIESYQWYSNKS